jgi:hypothetical protein
MRHMLFMVLRSFYFLHYIKRMLLLVSDPGLFIPRGLCDENQKSKEEE